ncbi:MAG: YitT family protein [Lactobacillaceae bacterium]|jgi:uncharacterized membrane-anchored protein YitT (DUF2179 family)|nr:YitT family protein [Lactobacillaceae bacterium]
MKNYQKIVTAHPVGRAVANTLVLVISAFSVSIALNWFLVPNHIFTGGFNGISQLLSYASEFMFGQKIDTGIFILISSLIIGVIGWKMIGSRFTILSTINSALVSFLVIVIPTVDVAHDKIIALIIAGILMGFGIGIAMRFGFSTGGMDIVAMILQKKTGKSVGTVSNVVNAGIILVAGLGIGWPSALNTLLNIYITGVTVDAVFTNQRKMTALIVTRKADEMMVALQKDLIRGITVMDSMGGYSKRPSKTLMMVISRVEIIEMQEIVLSVDPKAFINILPTTEVAGLFLDPDRQVAIKTGKEKLEVEEDA